MTQVSKSGLAKEINKSPAIVTRLINSGILDSCFTPDGKRMYLEKAITAIIHAKGSDYLSNTIEKTIPNSIVNNIEINNSEARAELDTFLEAEPSPSRQVDMIDKFWSGRIRRQKFLQEEGELITVDDAKKAVDILFTPLNKALDDLPTDFKSHFQETSQEAIIFLQNYINDAKEALKAHSWEH